MSFCTWSPPPPLNALIQTFWYWEGEQPPEHLRDTILPSASAGLLINLSADQVRWFDGEAFGQEHRLHGIVLAGPYARAIEIDAFHERMMGVQFHPGGAYPFFGCSLGELRNRHVALADIWASESRDLHEQLVEAAGPRDAFRILFEALLGHLRGDPAVDPVVEIGMRALAGSYEGAAVAKTAAHIGLDPKRFIDRFSDRVGFTPKTFQRLARFSRTVTELSTLQRIDWSDIVYSGGYYDQSHFIREFRQFSGLTPTEYARRRGPFLQHVPAPV